MKLNQLILNSIKKYEKELICDFNEGCSINTISGRNGSGKTTIFESLMLLQKAYFANEINNTFINTYKNKSIVDFVGEELYEFVNNQNSYIQVTITFYEDDFKIVSYSRIKNFLEGKCVDIIKEPYEVIITLKVIEILKENVRWTISAKTDEQKEVLDLFWNFEEPKNIVTYISADKTVEENDLTFEDIKFASNVALSPIVRFILEPEAIYSNLYSAMINDYIYERIIPQKPRKNSYFISAKSLFAKLMPHIKISNFTGQNREDQFILLANNGGKNFDIRKFSSGEKLIWYTLLLLNYIKYMGILVIDEPENHLHEELAWRFVKLLEEISNESIDKNEKHNLYLNQAFLITHSKNLIYNNFTNGSNYVIDEKILQKIDYESCERILRKFGLSYTNDRILFVEGDTDVNILESVIGVHNIQVKPLGNCAEIIRTFEGLKRIKDYLLDPRFVFLIDRDTRDDKTIEDMRGKDKEYFDSHFIVMPKHELENYFLDIKNMKIVLDEIQVALQTNKIEESEIEGIIFEYANHQLQYTKKKYMNAALRNKLNTVESLIKQNDLKIDGFDIHKQYIDEIFKSEKWNNIKTQMEEVFCQMENVYSESNWKKNWESLMDGKSVFNLTMDKLSKNSSVTKEVLIRKVKKQIISDKNSEFNKLIKDILELFNN